MLELSNILSGQNVGYLAKKIWVITNLGSKQIFDPKNFGSKNYGPKIIWIKKTKVKNGM